MLRIFVGAMDFSAQKNGILPIPCLGIYPELGRAYLFDSTFMFAHVCKCK